ncbi:MAG: flagellin, partial [Gammaproteobacteria bacterium]|nr:flagellin [Gammaproteobacteria bacterium]
SVTNAKLALTISDAAIQQIATQRAKFGALQSRFDSTIRNIQTAVENMSGARSRIQDADFAVETAGLSRAQILQQAGTAMLAQANTVQQNVLSLLR